MTAVLAKVIENDISPETWAIFFIVCASVIFIILIYNMMR
jgi:hypothetical protein